jgi:hypothetical protein
METIIPVFDMICLIELAVGIAWWQKRNGKLNEKQMSSIVIGYGVFFVLTTFGGIFWETHSLIAILLGLGVLLIVFVFGYPYARWLYRKFNSPK